MPDYRANAGTVRHLSRVRTLRPDQTDTERMLWQRLRGAQVGGYKFRRQHEFGGFILEFNCPAL
jgi:very-short-patch-repair endonuclease